MAYDPTWDPRNPAYIPPHVRDARAAAAPPPAAVGDAPALAGPAFGAVPLGAPVAPPAVGGAGGGGPIPATFDFNARGRQRYSQGQHGGRRTEQQRLTQEYGAPVSGDSHESEHIVGFAAAAGGMPRGRSVPAGLLERTAAAYQEQEPFHRAHVGTGPGGPADEYRVHQRTALETGSATVALQLNQLHYAALPGFTGAAPTPARLQADDSYNATVRTMGPIHYAAPAAAGGGSAFFQVPVSSQTRVEAEVARRVARGDFGGQAVPLHVENEVRALHGLPEIDGPMAPDPPSDDVDMVGGGGGGDDVDMVDHDTGPG